MSELEHACCLIHPSLPSKGTTYRQLASFVAENTECPSFLKIEIKI
jgi:hypothetical protein